MPQVIVIGGPSGTGKSTSGHLLASHYKCPYVEGDELHSKENVAKMGSGQPLTDDDRWGWLETLSKVSVEKATDPNNDSAMCVTSCSMLKKVYRDFIVEHGEGAQFRFVFLEASFEDVLKRVAGRQGHYMKSDMVKSQYDIMEPPAGDELVENGGRAICVNSGAYPPEQLVEQIVQKVKF